MQALAREAARAALTGIRKDGRFASAALAKLFSDLGLGPRDRALATELVYGVLRHRTRLDYSLSACANKGLSNLKPEIRDVLRIAAYQILMLDRVPDYAAVDDAVTAARQLRPRVAGLVNALLRELVRRGPAELPDPIGEPVEHARVALSLPDIVAEPLRRARGDDWLDAARGFGERPSLWLRCNATRNTPEELEARLVDEGVEVSRVLGNALEVAGVGDLSVSPSFLAGQWTVQDLGAQLVGQMVALEPKHVVLDACGGRGGKASHLAEQVGGALQVDVVDQNAARLAELPEACGRLGLSGITGIQADLRRTDVALRPSYDLVVLDAPCTGFGVLRRHPERKWRTGAWTPEEASVVQSELLANVAERVRPGGHLVYAVCSFTETEGPAVVQQFLEGNSQFQPERPALEGCFLDGDFLRTWPDLHGCDAFFAARLRRQS